MIPNKKLTNGFEISVFGLGTWMMGGARARDLANDDSKNISSIKSAIDHGITRIDTAESYAEGHAENLVGEATKSYSRAELFITTKVTNIHLKYDDIISACKASLERLQTSYLDLYLIHSPNLEIPLEESIRAMNALVDEGLIKNIGVSNFKTERLQEAQSYSKYPIVLNQVYYSLISREPEHEGLLSYCQDHDVILEAYRPFEKGSLFTNSNDILDQICRKYKKTPPQVALNWLLSQKNVVTLAKMNSEQHIRENLGAVGWTMDGSDIELLRKEYPGQIHHSEHLPLK